MDDPRTQRGRPWAEDAQAVNELHPTVVRLEVVEGGDRYWGLW